MALKELKGDYYYVLNLNSSSKQTVPSGDLRLGWSIDNSIFPPISWNLKQEELT